MKVNPLISHDLYQKINFSMLNCIIYSGFFFSSFIIHATMIISSIIISLLCYVFLYTRLYAYKYEISGIKKYTTYHMKSGATASFLKGTDILHNETDCAIIGSDKGVNHFECFLLGKKCDFASLNKIDKLKYVKDFITTQKIQSKLLCFD
jgi:hypothetical protein